MRKITLAAIAMWSVFLVSCEKQDATCYFPDPTFTVDGIPSSEQMISVELFDNEMLELASTYDTEGFTYNWEGPGGFQAEGATVQVPASSATSGEYVLTVTKGICTGTSTVNVEVNSISAPCTPVANKLIFEHDSLFPVNFTWVDTAIYNDEFMFTASASNTELRLSFATDAPPAAGVYQIGDCPTSFLEENEVCLSINYMGYWGQAAEGQVYVSRSETGKYSITFCEIEFSTSFPYPMVGSAYIIEQ